MQLPGDSENRIFLRPDGQVVMVVWNRQPTREILYLGDNVRQFDILGRSTPAAQQGREQVIDVGPTPTFVLGLHEAITRWRMNVQFEKTQVPSISSKPHHNSLAFKNFFPQGVGGSVKIVVLQEPDAGTAPNQKDAAAAAGFVLDRWTIEPPQTAFQLAANAEMKFPFDINATIDRRQLLCDRRIHHRGGRANARRGKSSGRSWIGIGLAAVTLTTMPALAAAKARVGDQLHSSATKSEGRQNMLCAYLSAALLVGLGANALFGWWWADPVTALVIAAVALDEGRDAWRGESCDDCC